MALRCKAPLCHRTTARTCKRTGTRIHKPARCVKPNAWNMFRISLSGQGYTTRQISALYKKWKKSWAEESRGLNQAAKREKTLADLCAQAVGLQREPVRASILAGTREARRKKARERATCFAKKKAPSGWSVNARQYGQNYSHRFEYRLRTGKAKSETLTKTDMKRFEPGEWFADVAINAYMYLLGGTGNPASKTCPYMNIFFYKTFTVTKLLRPGEQPDNKYYGKSPKIRHGAVKRWTRNLNTTGDVKMFVPVNHDNVNWTMIMIDVKKKQIVSMDSSGIEREEAMGEMLDWIEEEHR